MDKTAIIINHTCLICDILIAKLRTGVAMKNTWVIEKAVDYIEENLKNDISVGRIASIVGYSEYHFLRIFRQFVGLTPADYIRKRRISRIVDQMEHECGRRSISDIAFEYGFNSKENFTRAFKAEHHILPTEYRRCGNSLKLYARFESVPACCELDFDIVELAPFRIVAYTSDEEDPTNFWNKYNTRGLSKRLSGVRNAVDYGVCRWNPVSSRLDYWIGVPEQDVAGDASGTVTLSISGGLYAMFQTPVATHIDFVRTIRRTWDSIYREWLPQSRYEYRHDYEFECYVEKSRLFSETICVPIKIRKG